jgi:hypothetical protein
MILKTKKDLENFINNIDQYVDYLLFELFSYGMVGKKFEDYKDRIDEIQKFYEEEFLKKDEIVQEKLRLAFWAFFSKLLIQKLGGNLQIAPKNDYCEGTPQLINYGNRFDKKGKKKWIGIGFDSWLNTHLKKANNFTLNEKIISLIEDYS